MTLHCRSYVGPPQTSHDGVGTSSFPGFGEAPFAIRSTIGRVRYGKAGQKVGECREVQILRRPMSSRTTCAAREDLFRDARPADDRTPLEDENLESRLCRVAGGNEDVVTATDDHRVPRGIHAGWTARGLCILTPRNGSSTLIA